MSGRNAWMEALDALFDFGRVTATKVATQTKQVLASVRGNEGASGQTEERPFQVLWGHAAIMWRPPADTELLFTRRHEEMVPLASRDTRWLIELDEGDVVVRNLTGDHPVRLHLKADGTAVLEADTVKIGDASAGHTIGFGDAIKDALNDRATTFQNHTHDFAALVAGGGGGSVSGTSFPTSTPYSALPTIESVHKVE